MGDVNLFPPEWAMHFMVRAAALVVIVAAATGRAQSDPALRTQPQPGAQANAGSFVFPTPPPATVKDGFTYAVLGDISQVGPVTQLPLPEFVKVLRVVKAADFALANQAGTAFDVASKRFEVNDQGALYPSDT